MPVTSFLSSIADKVSSTPLGQHLPGAGRANSPDSAQQASANESGQKSHHALDTLTHEFRSFSQKYSSSTTPLQRLITAEKGLALDLDSVSRDAKAQSKELYTWGQAEQDDLKDVTDRLAYLNFVQGSLASSMAQKLDAARSPLKALRDAETALLPRRNIRAGLQLQLARLEHDNQKGMEKKIAELKDQIKKAEADDSPQEKEVDLLKRKAIRDSEQLKWEAIREYGEKLVLLSQAATPILHALPIFPPTKEQPYEGAKKTGAARASLQRALDNYKTGHINLPPAEVEGSDLSRSDTRSFGESHASELSSLNSSDTHSGIPLTPPTSTKSLGKVETVPTSASSAQSAPIDPSHLNLSPAPIPPPVSPATHSLTEAATNAPVTIGAVPTVAETGVPVSASASGPGPASGSLHEIRSPTQPQQKWESAEEEKKRLGQQYSQAYQPQPQEAAATESAEEEKKRLEREERQRILQAGASQNRPSNDDKVDEDLPAYQEI